ncbi:MAG: BamA/TamA family outer membrane protein, partial [Ignavibacteriales bacterium]
GDVHYLRTEADAGWYHGFNKDFILSATGTAGYINGWAGDPVRINDRFYKGGNTFRGFDTAGIGPRDTSFGRDDSLGGKLYAIGTVELTIPTYLPEQYGIKAALFSDFGTLGLLDKEDKQLAPGVPNTGVEDDLALRASAGISIFWRSPMGPIRFDISHVLAKEPYDKTQTFRFSTSTRF